MNTFAIDPGPLAAACQTACHTLEQRAFVSALWSRSLDVWTDDADVRERIAQRLGWLGAIDFITPQVAHLQAFGASIRAGGYTDVVLLGMGGSSLAPEVLRRVLGVAPGYPRFRMLDSVDPDAVHAALTHAPTSLFIFASKSGSTIEPNVMAAEARLRVLAAGHRDAGTRFVAITDEGTALHRRALEERFRDVFVNPADIGGRYSALSLFGMVPAAAMGVNLESIVGHAREMEQACREPSVTANPGVALGALMAAGAQQGRDKLTLFLPERLQSLGLWIEQLVAESTGKQGKGVVPIAGEPADVHLGADRIAVVVHVGRDQRVAEAQILRIRDAGLPMATIEMPDATAIGAEFLRWEIATAAAGLLLEINPFDEPNVQQAKDATRALLDVYETDGRLPALDPVVTHQGARLTASRAARETLGDDVSAFLRLIQPHDYFCLLAYLPPDDARFEGPLQDLRAAVARRAGCASMFGYGPRYLHSTGQLHKGGPNTGVFVILTAEPVSDLPVPDAPYTFGVLARAQAIGDFQSLDGTGRRALYVHLPDRDPATLRTIAAVLLEHP